MRERFAFGELAGTFLLRKPARQAQRKSDCAWVGATRALGEDALGRNPERSGGPPVRSLFDGFDPPNKADAFSRANIRTDGQV